jgi:predicted nucleotidyltransferase
VNKRNEILLMIKKSVSASAPKATVILYGSYARGDNKKTSDVDLLILLERDKITREDEKKVKYPLYEIEFETGQIISPLVLSKNDWETRHRITPFYENIKREGIIL